jgi:hypothetical protein
MRNKRGWELKTTIGLFIVLGLAAIPASAQKVTNERALCRVGRIGTPSANRSWLRSIINGDRTRKESGK